MPRVGTLGTSSSACVSDSSKPSELFSRQAVDHRLPGFFLLQDRHSVVAPGFPRTLTEQPHGIPRERGREARHGTDPSRRTIHSTSMHRMHRIFSGNGKLPMPEIRKSAPDHPRVKPGPVTNLGDWPPPPAPLRAESPRWRSRRFRSPHRFDCGRSPCLTDSCTVLRRTFGG